MADDTPGFSFSTEREAAAKIRDAARAAGHRLYALPYSRFDPDRSTWWLAATKANPAFSVGKLVVERPTIVADGAKLIGLHMEKGVGPKAAPFFDKPAKARRLVMDPSWTWHRFIRAMLSGEIDAQIERASVIAEGLPVHLEVVAALGSPPSLDGADERPVDGEVVDRVRYRFSDGQLSREAAQVESRLGALSATESAAPIAEKISAMDDLDWTWVEILIGVPFRPMAEAPISPTDLWRRVCEPWLRWLV